MIPIIRRRIFQERVNDRIEGANVTHGLSKALLNSAKEVCGETTAKRQRDKGSTASS